MKKINKIIVMSLIFLFGITIKSYAGSFGISVSPATAEPGSTVTINITGNNATGRINVTGSNIKLNSSYVWVENDTKTITGTLTGEDGKTATITAVASDLADSTSADDIKGSKSKSVSIKKKEQVVENKTQPVQEQQTQQAQQTQQIQPAQPAQAAKTQTTVAKAKTEPVKQAQVQQKNNQNQNVNENNNKTEIPKENNIEDQGTKAEFGICALYLFGVKENDEKVEIKFSPDFNINTAEYNCEVGDEIKKLQIDYDANEYKDLVKVDGIDKELNLGENVININMKNADGSEKSYKITVNKKSANVTAESNNENAEAKSENSNENQNNSETQNNKKEGKYIKMPVPAFIGLQFVIVLVEGILFGIAYMKILKKYTPKAKRSK